MPSPAHRAFARLALAGLVAHGLSSWPSIAFYPDDSYIYAQFVRVFVEHGEVAFNPGRPVYGVTSAAHYWLWALPLAALDLGSREAVVAWGKLLTALQTLAWVGVSAALVRRLVGGGSAGVLTMLLLGAHVWPARWHLSAMETALADLCFAGFLLALVARRPAAASLPLGVLHFTRPETMIWIPLWLGFLALVVGPRRGVATALRALAGYAVVGLVLAGSMLVATGALVPNTAGAKSAPLSLDPQPLVRIAELLASCCGPETLLLAAALAALWRAGRLPGDPRALLVATMVVVLLGFYWLRGVSLYTRYISFLYGVPILAVASLVAHRLPGWRPALATTAVAGLLLNGALNLVVVAPATRAYMASMERVNRPIARLIRETAPHGRPVAVADIGLIGFESERPTFDVVGLVSPEMLPVKWDGPATRALFDELRPSYLVNVTPEPGVIPFPGPETIRRTLVRRDRFDHMFVRPRPMYYELWRLEPYWPAASDGP